MKRNIIFGVVAFVLTVLARPLMAASPSEVRSLTGVVAVRVIVEDLNAALQKTGLRKEDLQSIVEKGLSKSGFAVLRSEDPRKVPLVYIRLSSVIGGEQKRAPISFYLVMQVKQLAVLANGVRPAVWSGTESGVTPLLVTTWENGTMAMLNRSELFFYVRHTLINLLGDLIRDQREANGLKSEG